MQALRVLLACTAVVVLVVGTLTRTGSCDNISLVFNNEIILRDAVNGVDFIITEDFQAAVATAVNTAAGTSTPITTSVYSVPPHLALFSSAWATGSAPNVEAEIKALNETYMDWRETPGSSIYASLNELCLSNIGRQPSVIDVTNTCSFYNDIIMPNAISACNRSLSLTFLSRSSPSNASALKDVLCRVLDTDCGLITCVDAGSETITTYLETVSPKEGLQPIVTMYGVMSCDVAAEDRNAALVTLVSFANFASVLSSQQISYIRAGGVQIYYEGREPRLGYEGTTVQCLPHYWYLIFFIILVPIILIAAQRFYLWGRKAGRKSIRDYEKDIRAGVHLSNNPWGAYGAGGMPMPQPLYPQQGGVQPPGGMVMSPQGGGGGWPSMRTPAAAAAAAGQPSYGQWQMGGYQGQQEQQRWAPSNGNQYGDQQLGNTAQRQMQQPWSPQQQY